MSRVGIVCDLCWPPEPKSQFIRKLSNSADVDKDVDEGRYKGKTRTKRDEEVRDSAECQGGRCLISAFVLAKLVAGKDREVLKEIGTIDGVEKATATYGIYDLVAEVSFESIDELDRFVFDKVRKIPHVKETVTVICSETVT